MALLGERRRAALFLPGLAWILAVLPLVGCFDVSSPAAPIVDAAAQYDAELAMCASVTNSYRASVNRPALARAERLEAYAAEAARHDASVREAHHYVRTTNFGDGLVRAENELLWWPLRTYGTVRAVVQAGLAQMWGEGADGPHYLNMVGDYTEVGCGVFVGNGEVTVAQAFR